ncbi:hypothetical protein [uncultured Caballeronia sp.]|uniref:hypothetical protein n=1 Tax=uncultured Caballeronia sp. TaxID=1827198 RepID=UPI0035CC2F8E
MLALIVSFHCSTISHLTDLLAKYAGPVQRHLHGYGDSGVFFIEFAGDTPWIHLDIAGCAWNEELKPWLPKGPTGIAVRSIVEWVRSY